MVLISTEIEIAAPPERVRQVFLDFAKYPEWCTFFKSIELATPNKTPETLAKGDKLKVDLGSMSFKPDETSPAAFRWTGSLPMIFSGTHSFCFEPSTATPGHTAFKNSEDFGGLLAFTMYESVSGKKTKMGFESFNAELKKRTEGLA